MNIKGFFLIAFYILFLSCNSQEIEIKDNQNIFGFCTSNTFTFFDVEDTLFTNKILQIDPQVLRFPGGSLGNFYHINSSGYGFNLDEIREFHSQKFSKRVAGLIRAQQKNNHTSNYIEDFIKLAKLTNAKVVLVANVLTGDKDELISMIERFNSEKIEILGIELGSELSNRAYKKHIKSVADYIILAKKAAKNIRSEFPEIQLAVVASPIKADMPKRLINWNSYLAKEDFYDAIVYHSYAKIVDGEAESGVMISEYPVNLDNRLQFDLYKDRVLVFQNDFISNIKNYNKIFNNKEIWITEWNLQMTKTTANTMIHSLFISQYLMDILCVPDLQNIKIAMYHNLAGRDVSGSIFKAEKEGFVTHSTFFPFSILSDIFDGNIIRVDKKSIDDNQTYEYKCYDSDDKLQMLYIVNWSGDPYHYYIGDYDLRFVQKFYTD